MVKRHIKIIHKATGIVLAEGPLGWKITQFEGNYYVEDQCLNNHVFKVNFLPGICFYKFFYVWVDLVIDGKTQIKNFAWKNWLPNPLLPFIWFRVAIPGGEMEIEYVLSEECAG